MSGALPRYFRAERAVAADESVSWVVVDEGLELHVEACAYLTGVRGGGPWLAAQTPSSWRPGEWDATTRLFTGDVDNRCTVAYHCTVASCDRISRTRSG
jgi:hypothetical protein